MTTSRILTPVVTLAVGAVFGLAACSPATPTATTTTTTTTTATAAASTSDASPSASSTQSTQSSPTASSSASSPASATSTSSSSSSSSTSGETQTVSGDGYSFDLPADWVAVSQPTIELGYKAPKATDGFFTNVVTSQQDPGGVGLEEGTAATAKQEEKDGATNVRTGTTTLDGEPATTIDMMRTSNGSQVRQRQVLCIHDGKLFILTASMHGGASDSDLDDLVDPITTSWEWV